MAEDAGLERWLQTDVLFSLLDSLRAAQFRIDVRHYQCVQDLALALAAADQPTSDPSRLRSLIAPIVCHSAAEQRHFAALFGAWLRDTTRDLPNAVVARPPLAEALRAVHRRAARWRGALVATVLGLALVAAVLTYSLSTRPTATSPVLFRLLRSVNDAPLEGALLWGDYALFVGLLAAAAGAAWMAFWRRTGQQFLVREATTATPAIQTVSIKSTADRLYDRRTLARVAAACRARSIEPGSELAIRQSLEQTAREGGWLSPVFASRRVLPEYLALIERSSYADQQASLVEHMLASLSRAGVFISRYFFERDPRVCAPEKQGDQPATLRELAQRYANHRLLVFSSTSSFADPVTGKPADWIADCRAWPERAILVPGADRFTEFEVNLAADFTILPATLDGLRSAALAWQTHSRPERPASGPAAGQLPLAISSDADRWLDRHPPSDTDAAWLLRSLRAHLGQEAFSWLAACAVYPDMHWSLTITLGYALEAHAGEPFVSIDRLAAICQLPWFKHGYFPDWLRRYLVDMLPPEAADVVRRTLDALFVAAVRGDTGDAALQVVRERAPRSAVELLSRAIRRNVLTRRDAPTELRDYVFLRFMAGRRTRPLAVRVSLPSAPQLPRELPWLERGLRIFANVRPGEGAGVALMFVSLSLLSAAHSVLMTVREPLILLSAGPEGRSYAVAAQALVLVGILPVYGWLASRFDKVTLLIGSTAFFILGVELFALAIAARVPYVGVTFFVWQGLFSVSVVARFFSFANDFYDGKAAKRVFPAIAAGSTVGLALGYLVAGRLFGRGLTPQSILQVSAALLLASLLTNYRLDARNRGTAEWSSIRATSVTEGLANVFRNGYVGLLALFVFLTNATSTVGDYLLARILTAQAYQTGLADAAFNAQAFIGAFTGDYEFWVSVIAVVLQLFVAQRLLRSLGMSVALSVLPLVAVGGYTIVAAGVGLLLMRWVKTAEHATDSSIKASAYELTWLALGGEQHQARETVNTLFTRGGSILAAVLVYLGTTAWSWDVRRFAIVNIVLATATVVLARAIHRRFLAALERQLILARKEEPT